MLTNNLAAVYINGYVRLKSESRILPYAKHDFDNGYYITIDNGWLDVVGEKECKELF